MASGDVSLTGAEGVSLTGEDWNVQYDDLGDLSGSPAVVDTGAENITLDFGSDARSGTDGATTSASTTFTAASASFTSADVGKTIRIDGVTYAIQAVTSSTR